MVLIIDDEYALQEVMSEILELSGIPVICASNGEEGMATLVDHGDEIQAVFLDLHMPGMNGLATLQSIRAFNPNVAVVIMSGQPKTTEVAEVTEQAHLLYLEKPFTLDILIDTVKSVLVPSDSSGTP